LLDFEDQIIGLSSDRRWCWC